ncbi:hypothetical protein AB0M29_00580 [Streptomyces sp. NPDC051976]|uniref:hypothetical protein n=1 Tax=Streptomyces sp. NPDC051976 TaxID=3154947 RepID=UPI00341B155E
MSWFKKQARVGAAAEGEAGATPPGMLAEEGQDVRAAYPADAGCQGAAAAAREGRWEPGAELLAEAGKDWDRRSAVVAVLGEAAAEEDDWLYAWQEARPGDPDAAVVEADGLVRLAWRMRGGKQAQHTGREQFDAFTRVLGRARDACHRAAELTTPTDPTPYAVELSVGLGLGYSHDDFRELFAEVVERAPYHQSAHGSAMQFWCEKWHGSADLAFQFAQAAAAAAPPGLLFSRFPLISWFEHHDYLVPAPDDSSPALTALVDAALADAAAATEDSAQLRALRHVLAYYLYRQARYTEALDQFRAVDGHIGALPWVYAPRPARMYTLLRDTAYRAQGGAA